MKPAPIYHTLLMGICLALGVLIGHWITAGIDARIITEQKTTIRELANDLQEIRASIAAGLNIQL